MHYDATLSRARKIQEPICMCLFETYRAVHLRRILEQVLSLNETRGATLLRAANAVVRGIHGIEELRASLEGTERHDSEQHFEESVKAERILIKVTEWPRLFTKYYLHRAW